MKDMNTIPHSELKHKILKKQNTTDSRNTIAMLTQEDRKISS